MTDILMWVITILLAVILFVNILILYYAMELAVNTKRNMPRMSRSVTDKATTQGKMKNYAGKERSL